MGTNYAPLLAGLFLYSYEAEFVQKLLQDEKKMKHVTHRANCILQKRLQMTSYHQNVDWFGNPSLRAFIWSISWHGSLDVKFESGGQQMHYVF
jgi:hypothetical protein